MSTAPGRRPFEASHREGTSDPEHVNIGSEGIWQEPVEELLAQLATTRAGLASSEVQARLEYYGPNDAAIVKRLPLWRQFVARFRNPLVIILLVASALSAAAGDVASFVVVATIVTLSMTLDFVQEVRAQNAVEVLRRSVAVQATVRRDGAPLSIPIDQLVPGDIVELIAGDLVPASTLDCLKAMTSSSTKRFSQESRTRPKSRLAIQPWALNVPPARQMQSLQEPR